MLKNTIFKRIAIATLGLIIVLMFSLFPNNFNDIKDQTLYINSVKTPIYILDNNNYVSRVTALKKGDNLSENISYLVDYLTINNPNSIYIPFGFKGLIPDNTKLLDFQITNNILKLNFSKELLNIEEDNEEKLIESLIYTFTELKEVDKIMLFVEGNNLLRLPHSNKILPPTLDRTYGINKLYTLKSFKNINIITTYYMASINDFNYYIPVTSINNDSQDKVQIIIKNLQTSPIYQTNLNSYLASAASLTNYEILENSISLSFNNNLIANINDKSLLEEVKYSIFLSLKDSYNIKSVIFNTPNQITSIII